MSGATAERQHAPRGDERRAALLASLDQILQEGPAPLDSINIADISRRAGVTRSAFYFYFESKAAAVAALSQEMYQESMAAAAELRGDGTPRANIEATILGLFGAWERHQHLFRAMLDARAGNAGVRDMWTSDRESFIDPLAALIDDERAAGRAPSGSNAPDARALAQVLLELNDRMLERLALGEQQTPAERDRLVSTVVHVWLSSIYGSAS